MRNKTAGTHSVAVFPFLKTSNRVILGGLTFRSTDDLEGLSPDEVASVNDIAGMLFLKDDFRVRKATYAVIPFVDLTYSNAEATYLTHIQAVVAYLYASPHEVFGDPFLSSEHATLIVFSPGEVSHLLIQPDFNVEPVVYRELEADQRDYVAGYHCLYNFRHHFWVARGSRVYGPKPHMTLNRSQDLYLDVEGASHGRDLAFGRLQRVIQEPLSSHSSRVLTAIRWFNEANRESNGEDAALVSLAIAFESLLGLPQAEKTDRLIDAISLILGRVPRLDTWAQQFYRARSAIVHEGRTEKTNFIATDSKQSADGPTYQSLLSYGVRIFRLCLATLLIGADLARQAGLEEILVTNQQRFEKIVRTLSDSSHPESHRLTQVEELVEALDRYKFLSESGLQIGTMLDSVRLAADALVKCGVAISEPSKSILEASIVALRSKDRLSQLEATQGLEPLLAGDSFKELQCADPVRKLVQVVWGYVFQHYYWLKQQQEDNEASNT